MCFKIYGFTNDRSFILRDVQTGFGMMRSGISSDRGKEMLPIAGADEVDCRRDLVESDTGCYLAGDIRANEQVMINYDKRPVPTSMLHRRRDFLRDPLHTREGGGDFISLSLEQILKFSRRSATPFIDNDFQQRPVIP